MRSPSLIRVTAVALLALVIIGACSDRPSSRPGSDSGPKTASTPSASERCVVNALLVPSCGAWLGASTPSGDGLFDYAVGLAEYEAVAKNTPDIQHFYKRNDTPFPTADEIALSERPGVERSILFYSWKPSTTLTWREIADGGADPTIAVVADSLRAYGRRLFLAIHHEPENDEGAEGSGMTAADYVEMYRSVVGALLSRGVDNVVYVMNYIGYRDNIDLVERFYPGDDVVDWIAYDPYGFTEGSDFADLINSPGDGWDGFYVWATQKSPGTPIMLAEWGFDLTKQPDAAETLADAPQTLAEQFPMVKALVYWHDVGGSPDFQVRLDLPTDDGRAFGQAYAVMANDPYFNRTSTAAAP